MSDPVTNVEIEDVLSSIRRLVSENARMERPDAPSEDSEEDVAGDAGQQAAPAPQDGGMLVLTADHLVEDATGPSVEEAHSAAPPDETHHWGDDGAETAVEEAAEQAVVDAAIEGAVQDAVEAVVQEMADENAEVAAGLQENAVAGETALAEDVAEAPLRLEPLQFTHRDAVDEDDMSSLANRIAGLEAAVAARDDQWEPDGEDDDDNAGGPVEALNWEDDTTDDDAPSHAWEADRLSPIEEAEVLEGPVQESEPEAAVPELEAIDPVPDAIDPEPDMAADPESELDPELAEADPQLAQDLEPEPDIFAEPDAVMDEEALRELVAEIVRRELQGSLGERITRNVRKLVRREIHRALAARELD